MSRPMTPRAFIHRNQITGWTQIITVLYGFLRRITIKLTAENIAVMSVLLRVYEGNDLQIKSDGPIYINGKQATTYALQDGLLLDDGR